MIALIKNEFFQELQLRANNMLNSALKFSFSCTHIPSMKPLAKTFDTKIFNIVPRCAVSNLRKDLHARHCFEERALEPGTEGIYLLWEKEGTIGKENL